MKKLSHGLSFFCFLRNLLGHYWYHLKPLEISSLIYGLNKDYRLKLFEIINKDEVDWIMQFVDLELYTSELQKIGENTQGILQKVYIPSSFENLNALVQIVNAQSFGWYQKGMNKKNEYDIKNTLTHKRLSKKNSGKNIAKFLERCIDKQYLSIIPLFFQRNTSNTKQLVYRFNALHEKQQIPSNDNFIKYGLAQTFYNLHSELLYPENIESKRLLIKYISPNNL